MWLMAFAVNTQAAFSIGARTQIWPFLFVDRAADAPGPSPDEIIKSDIAIGNLDQYAELGAQWNIVDVWQDVDGPDGYHRIERAIHEHEIRGIQVALRILERPEIYDDIRSGGDTAARALQDYSLWVGQIARKFGTRVRYYMISNETDHDVGFNRTIYRKFRPVTVNEYGALLRTAHASIKRVDARLAVADHGVSSYSVCLAVMADLALDGRLGDALEFWRAMAYSSPGEGDRTLPKLIKKLASADARHRIEFARRTAAELTRYRDAFQLHHYYGADVLPDILAWLRSQFGNPNNGHPIVAAETGYQIPAKKGKAWDGRPRNVADLARYSEMDHGASIAKVFATLAGNGINDMLYWQIRFHDPRGVAAPLYAATEARDEFKPSYPADVYKFVVSELQDATATPPTPNLGSSGLVEHRFQHGTDFSLLWAKGGKTAVLPPNLRGRVARVADAKGRPIDSDNWDGRIGAAPIFVYWQPQTAKN
jgi:hypothetical protein